MESMRLILLFILILAISKTGSVKGSQNVLQAVEWKNSKPLYDYKSYGAITLALIDIPAHTLMTNLTLNALSTPESCIARDVDVYANQDGIPVVSRDGEDFPKNFHTPDLVPNITISTDNKTNHWVLSNLRRGSLVIMAILPHQDTRIRQKGLYTECRYFISIRALTTYLPEDSIPLLTNKETKETVVHGNSKSIIGLKIPPDTISFQVEIGRCSNGCKFSISMWQTLSPGMWTDQRSQLCTEACTLTKTYPNSDSLAYIGVNVLSAKDASIPITLTLNTCTQHGTNETISALVKNNLTTGCVLALSRYTDAFSNDYQDRFVAWELNDVKPAKIVSVPVPEDTMSVMRFDLRASDTGASLQIKLTRPGKSKSKSKQNVELMLCASLSKIAIANSCSNGASILIRSDSKKEEMEVIIPYPEGNSWYLTLQSRCFNESSNTTTPCVETPRANITIRITSCVDGGCGDHGTCKLYSGAGIIYSACSCYSGWCGYSCNDGSKADSLTMQKVAVYLLTLSNLAFIPGICLALYRRYFIEAFVYSFNMFFSTFYHACDSSHVYKLCILPFGTLIFADFFASLMSFAVTLLAMARIPLGLRSFLHMLAAMFVAVGEVHNRHGLFEQLTPIATGLAVVAFSWGYEMYKRKSFFPSKRRYLIFIAPGLALALLGLSLYLAVETEDNYKYVHSAWHVLVATAIAFLLPPRRPQKWSSDEQPLSIQSGDVTSSNPCLFDSHQPGGFQNADDPNPAPPATETTALHNGGNFMLTSRNGSNRSYPL